MELNNKISTVQEHVEVDNAVISSTFQTPHSALRNPLSELNAGITTPTAITLENDPGLQESIRRNTEVVTQLSDLEARDRDSVTKIALTVHNYVQSRIPGISEFKGFLTWDPQYINTANFPAPDRFSQFDESKWKPIKSSDPSNPIALMSVSGLEALVVSCQWRPYGQPWEPFSDFTLPIYSYFASADSREGCSTAKSYCREMIILDLLSNALRIMKRQKNLFTQRDKISFGNNKLEFTLREKEGAQFLHLILPKEAAHRELPLLQSAVDQFTASLKRSATLAHLNAGTERGLFNLGHKITVPDKFLHGGAVKIKDFYTVPFWEDELVVHRTYQRQFDTYRIPAEDFRKFIKQFLGPVERMKEIDQFDGPRYVIKPPPLDFHRATHLITSVRDIRNTYMTAPLRTVSRYLMSHFSFVALKQFADRLSGFSPGSTLEMNRTSSSVSKTIQSASIEDVAVLFESIATSSFNVPRYLIPTTAFGGDGILLVLSMAIDKFLLRPRGSCPPSLGYAAVNAALKYLVVPAHAKRPRVFRPLLDYLDEGQYSPGSPTLTNLHPEDFHIRPNFLARWDRFPAGAELTPFKRLIVILLETSRGARVAQTDADLGGGAWKLFTGHDPLFIREETTSVTEYNRTDVDESKLLIYCVSQLIAILNNNRNAYVSNEKERKGLEVFLTSYVSDQPRQSQYDLLMQIKHCNRFFSIHPLYSALDPPAITARDFDDIDRWRIQDDIVEDGRNPDPDWTARRPMCLGQPDHPIVMFDPIRSLSVYELGRCTVTGTQLSPGGIKTFPSGMYYNLYKHGEDIVYALARFCECASACLSVLSDKCGAIPDRLLDEIRIMFKHSNTDWKTALNEFAALYDGGPLFSEILSCFTRETITRVFKTNIDGRFVLTPGGVTFSPLSSHDTTMIKDVLRVANVRSSTFMHCSGFFIREITYNDATPFESFPIPVVPIPRVRIVKKEISNTEVGESRPQRYTILQLDHDGSNELPFPPPGRIPGWADAEALNHIISGIDPLYLNRRVTSNLGAIPPGPAVGHNRPLPTNAPHARVDQLAGTAPVPDWFTQIKSRRTIHPGAVDHALGGVAVVGLDGEPLPVVIPVAHSHVGTNVAQRLPPGRYANAISKVTVNDPDHCMNILNVYAVDGGRQDPGILAPNLMCMSIDDWWDLDPKIRLWVKNILSKYYIVYIYGRCPVEVKRYTSMVDETIDTSHVFDHAAGRIPVIPFISLGANPKGTSTEYSVTSSVHPFGFHPMLYFSDLQTDPIQAFDGYAAFDGAHLGPDATLTFTAPGISRNMFYDQGSVITQEYNHDYTYVPSVLVHNSLSSTR